VSRPIPIDDRAITALATKIAGLAHDHFASRTGSPAQRKYGSYSEILPRVTLTYRVRVGPDRGRRQSTDVVVETAVDKKHRDLVLSAIIGRYGGAPEQSLLLTLNGVFTWAELARASRGGSRSRLARALVPPLRHEVTHLVDPRVDFKKVGYDANRDPSTAADFRAYFNTPTELRAYMQEAAAEVRALARKAPHQAHAAVIAASYTYGVVHPWLTSDNDQRMIRALVRSIDLERARRPRRRGGVHAQA
jgi:hypothetical protein